MSDPGFLRECDETPPPYAAPCILAPGHDGYHSDGTIEWLTRRLVSPDWPGGIELTDSRHVRIDGSKILPAKKETPG